MSDKPLSSSAQVSGTHAMIHAEAQVRLLSLGPHWRAAGPGAHEEARDR